jgi:hypothetical protein
MYSYSVSRVIAFFVAISSIAPILSVFPLLSSGRSAFDLLPPAAWYFYLGFIGLLVLWVTIVYRVVLLYLSQSAEVAFPYQTKHSIWSRLTYGVVLKRILSGHAVVTDSKQIVLQPGIVIMVFLSATAGLIGSLSIISLSELILGNASVAPRLFDTWQLAITFIILIGFVSPLAETLVMAAMLDWARKRWFGFTVLPLVSGLIWGGLHACINDPIQFLPITWLFWVLSSLYLHMRIRHTFFKTCVVTYAAHVLNNCMLFVLVFLRYAWF